MKKILLSMTVILVTVFSVNAQIFNLSWDGVALGDTLVISPANDTIEELVFDAILHNSSDRDVSVKVVRERIVLLTDTEDYFCWGACYPAHIDSSGMAMVIPAGGQSGDIDFQAHYSFHGVIGVSIIKYTFYDEITPGDQISIIVKYDTRVDGINETIFNNISVSNIYPNPATNYVSMDYDLPREIETASVKIVNLLGSVIKEQQIEAGTGKLTLDISDINDGIYFYSLTVNGDIYNTKKLIIR